MKRIVSHMIGLNDLKLISKIKDKLQNFQFIEVDTEKFNEIKHYIYFYKSITRIVKTYREKNIKKIIHYIY